MAGPCPQTDSENTAAMLQVYSSSTRSQCAICSVILAGGDALATGQHPHLAVA